MDFITSVFDWYTTNAQFFPPVLISIFVLGVSLGAVQLFEDNMVRTALIFPVAAFLMVLGFLTGDFGRELYFNFSAELFSALIALMIVGLASQLENWTTPLLLVALTAFVLIFFLDTSNLQSSISTNLATGIIGAYLTAYFIHKEWSWSPQAREKRLSNALRQTRKEREKQEAQMGDFFMLISGTDEGAIQQRIDFLKQNDMLIASETPTEQDSETKLYYRLITAKIQTVVKNPETVLLQNQETRVQVLGYPDSTKKVFKQISEVLELGEQKRLEAPDKAMLHVEFKAQSPSQLYSAYLEEQIYKLARDWQYGEDEVLQAATDDLLEWAKSMNFIKK